MIWLITVSFNDLFSCKHPTPKCMYCTLVLLYAMARLVVVAQAPSSLKWCTLLLHSDAKTKKCVDNPQKCFASIQKSNLLYGEVDSLKPS